MNESFTINGDLPLLEAQAISGSDGNVVVQVRCPAGLSMLIGDDALKLAENIRHQLNLIGFESAWLKSFKAEFDKIMQSMTDEELVQEFKSRGCEVVLESSK